MREKGIKATKSKRFFKPYHPSACGRRGFNKTKK